MIDSTHAQGSSGLATALKDRPACVMPVQPNRSLPVLPAPHLPYRARRASAVSEPGNQLQNVQGTFTNANSTGSLSSSSSSTTSTTSPVSSPSPSPLSSAIHGTQFLRCTLDLEKIGMPNLKKSNELIRKPVINIIQESTRSEKNNYSRRLGKRKSDDGIENINTNTSYAPRIFKDVNNYNFIDISKSPERYDTIVADSSVNVDPLSLYYTNDSEAKRESGPIKKRRKRKDKKPEEEEMAGPKIVPPLRLKKIQSLQANVSYQPNQEERVNQIIERERLECLPNIRYYQPPPEVPIVPDRPREGKEHASKYRIVSGQTPPYDERIDSSTMSTKDLQELHSRKNHLNLKLIELKKKTDELRQIMFKAPPGSVQETIDSYARQIVKLTNLLEMLPQVPQEITNNGSNGLIKSKKTNDLPNLNASPPCSTTYSEIPSQPSPEPPKLSPKIPIDFEATEERNSPPLLPRATSRNGNCEYWEDNYKQLQVNSSIITTTTGSIVTEQIDIDDKPEYLDLSTDAKSEMNRIEVCDTEQGFKDLQNPESLVIDTTMSKYEKESDNEYSPENSLRIDESEDLDAGQNVRRVITPIGVKVVDNLTPAAAAARHAVAAAAITSSCDIMSNQKGKSKVKDKRAKSPSVVINDHQFPDLGTWLANFKLPNHQAQRPIDKNTRPASVINAEVSPYSHYYYPQQEVPKTSASPGLKQKNLEVKSSEQLKQWESEQLQNSNSNLTSSLLEAQLQQKNQQLDPQVYSPVSVNRLLTRYPVEPYRLPFLRPASQLSDGLTSNSMSYSSTPPLMNTLSMSQTTPLSYWPQSIPKTHSESKRFTDMPLNYDPLSLTKRSTYPQFHPLLPSVPINLINSPYQLPQQRQQQPQQHHYERLWDKGHCLRPSESPLPSINYSWQNALFSDPLISSRSYLNSNWTSDPRNLLSTITPAMKNFSAPYPPINVPPRVRSVKERPESVRNCETPHLGKVNYSPNTARTVQCSNCGSRGPVYKCLGCEAAFYCNETCQARHWNCHVTICPKKMPKLKKVVPEKF